MDTGIERIPPNAIETEQSVLAACMIDSRAVARAAVILQGDPDAIWYQRPHALIWRALYDLWDEGEPTDSVTVADRMRVAGTLETAGGWEYVHGLEQGAFTAANVEHHARTVLGKARARRLIEIGAQLREAGYDDVDLPAVVARTVDDLWSLTAERTADAWVFGDGAVAEAMDAYRKAKESGGALSGVPTGLLDLDRLTGGWQPGDLVLVGARPGMGKTSLAVTAALAAAKAGHAVGLVSLEMSRRQVGQRILAQAAGISLTVIRTGQGSDTADADLQDAAEATKGAPIWIDDSPGLSVSDLRARVRHLVHRREAKLVIVDYLQLLDPDERSESSERETREISKALKRLAREAQVPVMALCQLSRQSEGRADKRPQLADLRYSGCLRGDTLVYLPDDARWARIDSMVGACPVVAARDGSRIVRAQAGLVVKSGWRDMLLIRTGSGLSISATSNHKFLTRGGWVPLSSLVPGAKLAVAAIGNGRRQRQMDAVDSVLDMSAKREPGDVYWDSVATITAGVCEMTYDISVPGLQNFVANGLIVHNSLEQDADLVLLLHRPEAYGIMQDGDGNSTEGRAEVILAKHRQGATAVIAAHWDAPTATLRNAAWR